MEANGPGKWRCVIRRRANQRPKNAATNRQRIFAGRTYLALASTIEEAEAINSHVKQRLDHFKDIQKKERHWLAERVDNRAR